MLVSRSVGLLPISKNVRLTASAGGSRVQPQDRYYDHITLSSAGQEESDGFRAMVASLSQQVRTYNPTGKIQELSRQVSSGEYQVSPREVAARMLLMEEGE